MDSELETSHLLAAKRANKSKIVIIGAGPTAFGCLRRLFKLREECCLAEEESDITVIEQEFEVGGLASTVTTTDGFSWDLGVHITGVSKYPEFLEAVCEGIPEWKVIQRNVKAHLRHVIECASNSSSSKTTEAWSSYVPYPVQNSIAYFPEEVKNKCLEELELAQEKSLKENSFTDVLQRCNDFDTFSKSLFGETLQRIFLQPYNEKVWRVKLAEMSCKWVEGRVPRIDTHILRSSTLNEAEKVQKSFFRYPANKCKGIGGIWRQYSKNFPAEIFSLGQKVVKIDPFKKEVHTVSVSNSDSKRIIQYDYLISTIPIIELGKISGLANEIPLKHSKVVLVGIGLLLPQNKFSSELCWAYYPTKDVIFYRCTVISNFSEELTPNPQQYWSVLCEIGQDPEEVIEDESKIIEKTIEDLIFVGIIEDKVQVCSRWLKILPYGYPVPTVNRDEVLKNCHATFQAHNIYTRGRFGGWCYEVSNQDYCFRSGIELIDKIFLGIPETVYQLGNT